MRSSNDGKSKISPAQQNAEINLLQSLIYEDYYPKLHAKDKYEDSLTSLTI